MRVDVITPPAPVVVWEDADARLRLGGDARQRDDVEAMIAAATAHIDGPDGWLGRAIGLQTLEVRTDVFRDAIRLPYPPIVEIVSVKHLNGAGAEATVLPSEYEVRGSLLGSSFGRRWPMVGHHSEAVRIRYRAGYQVVPDPIKAAILLMTADLYRNRETVAAVSMSSIPMSLSVQQLLQPFRVYC